MKKLIIILTALAMLCTLAAQEGQEAEVSTEYTTQVDVTMEDDGETTIIINENGEITTYSGDFDDEELKELLAEHNVILAQANEELEEMEEELREVQLQIGTAIGEGSTFSITSPVVINLSEEDMEKPFMGVYYEEITLSEAREMGYEKFYGVLISGVVSDSPARLYRILEDDIIMEIGGRKVLNEESFSKIIDSHYIGDAVEIKLFRDGRTEVIDFVFGSRKKTVCVDEITGEPVKPKLNPGDGGGSWIPVFFQPDLEDINKLISGDDLVAGDDGLGFSEIDDRGLFFNGGGGKGNVGKGWMLGGMGCGYSLDRKTSVPDPVDPSNKLIRRMNFSAGYGGVTLDKRIPITKKFITSLGFMLGWGGWNLEVSQTDGDYDWNTFESSLNNSSNNYVSIGKTYILIQPKVMVMYRILDWLAIRAEVGYMYSYSFYSGWKVEMIDENYEIKNSPDTTFDGMTFTVGPWFGF
ncbi:MAG: PDZ domain-containing protein [Candidatus Cloacimonetes bacterium]|nr:PDZ domain-containing protein [Candidatus Cloacimonadota bacterium]